MRYCTQCAQWYHLACLRLRATVEDIRLQRRTVETPWWIVWSPPAGIPHLIGEDLVRLITLSIQRGYRVAAVNIHPVLSFESFTFTLRNLFQNHAFRLPVTAEEVTCVIQTILKRTLLDASDASLRDATVIIRALAEVPLNQRNIYFCPRNDSHYL